MSSLVQQATAAIAENDRGAVSQYLSTQRWFGAKDRRIESLHLLDHAALAEHPYPIVLCVVAVTYADGPGERYFLPFVIRRDHEMANAGDRHRITSVPSSDQPISAWDAAIDGAACAAILEGIRHETQWDSGNGRFVCSRTQAAESLVSLPLQSIKPIAGEQSNTSVIYDGRVILKLIRKLQMGINPDSEILEFLSTRTRYPYVPALMGQIRYAGCGERRKGAGDEASIAVLQSFMPSHGDGWSMAMQHLTSLVADRDFQRVCGREMNEAVTWMKSFSQGFFRRMRRLGEITAGLHRALASDPSSAAFRPEAPTSQDAMAWRQMLAGEIRTAIEQLRAFSRADLARLSLDAEGIRALEQSVLKMADDATLLHTEGVMNIRIHGDYHLGQVLDTDPDFVILDFEGEPARPLAVRRAKACALKDVGGMLRSFSYARHAAERTTTLRSDGQRLALTEWEHECAAMFLTGYRSAATAGFLPTEAFAFDRLLSVFQLEKAIYELGYELHHRPDWIEIPIEGLSQLTKAARP